MGARHGKQGTAQGATGTTHGAAAGAACSQGGGHTHGSPRGRTTPSTKLLAAAAIVCALVAAYFLVSEYLTRTTYDRLAAQATSQAAGDDAGGAGLSIDWDALLVRNAELAAWLQVDNTSIDLPVLQPAQGRAADYYLYRDFDGVESYLGCPYIDMRATAQSAHMLVYGHTNSNGLVFAPLQDAYDQAIFDTLGTARWYTPDGARLDFTPLFAMNVSANYQPAQSFDFASVADMRAWAREYAADATATAQGWEDVLDASNRILTLVTCSSVNLGEPNRTLVVFAANDASYAYGNEQAGRGQAAVAGGGADA